MTKNRNGKKIRLKETQLLILGYLLVILVGSFLLSLPAASRDGEWTNYADALFTATSSTCVTGLVTADTFLKWTGFGQVVILILIQIGGLGFMTVITTTLMVLGRKIGLYERKILMQSAGTMRLSGIVHLVRRITIGTAIFEGAGALLLATRLCPKLGFWEGLYSSVFHSVSAFCNAGYDLMGRYGAFGSLAAFSGDWVVCLTIMGLIFMGGIGFIVWSDVLDCGFNPKKFSLHTKIALYGTTALIFAGALLFWLFEKATCLSEKRGRKLPYLYVYVGDSPHGRLCDNKLRRGDGQLSASHHVSDARRRQLGRHRRRHKGHHLCCDYTRRGFLRPQRRRHRYRQTPSGKNLVNQALGLLAVYLAAIFAAILIMSAIEPFSLADIGIEVFRQ